MLMKSYEHETTVDRLMILRDIMSKVPEREFDISRLNHPCGTPACVAGHLCASEAFKSRGILPNWHVLQAADFLKIPLGTALELCWCEGPTDSDVNTCRFWGTKNPRDITPAVVVAKLDEMIRAEVAQAA